MTDEVREALRVVEAGGPGVYPQWRAYQAASEDLALEVRRLSGLIDEVTIPYTREQEQCLAELKERDRERYG